MKELLARKAPALLASITNSVAEAVVTINRSLRQRFPPGGTFKCVTTPKEEDSTERTSFLTSVEDREEREDDHNIWPLLEGPLLEGPLSPEGPVGAVERMFGPLESTELVATQAEKKKRRKK